MELDHIFHPSHKLTYKKSVKKNVEGVVCAACLDDISSENYSCAECNFFLHKLCAQAPLELTHEFHPLHPLRLLQESPYVNSAVCDSCGKTIEGFIYNCEICDFDLDFICAFPDELKMNHVCHPEHVLNYEKVMKKADKWVICAACLEGISGPLVDYYSCRKCNFFLHELCSRQPTELTSSLHEHPLRLSKGPNRFTKDRCRSCKNLMEGFVYDCSACDAFFLDFKCAFPKTQNRIQNFEELHHHPLIFQPRPGKFSCDLCSSTGGEWEGEDQSYSCSICDFWIHQSCAFTTLTEQHKGHPHPLSLGQGVPKDLQIYDCLGCVVCYRAVFPEDWVSYCAHCLYLVHIGCMIADDTIKDAVDYLDDSLFKYIFKDDEFDIVDWPPKDISSELIQPFLLTKRGIVMVVQPKIRIFSHMQHDMTLFKELAVNNDNFFEEEDEEILCDACIHPITAPYYCCQECNYFLHVACANLPSSIKHFSHPNELELQDFTEFYKSFRCNRCQHHCNGWGYWCKTREFVVDLICAALPAVILHAGHEHPLFQERAGDESGCNACGHTTRDGQSIFRCRLCDFYLHHMCATLSGHIRHRWDRHHPLALRIPPYADLLDYIMCDMCESFIGSMKWFYSCFQCDISFHILCAPRYFDGIYPNIKYGGKVKISSHHHVLQFLKQATVKRYCDKCEEDLRFGRGVFECETCYACFCYSCVRSECEGMGRANYPQHEYLGGHMF